MFVPSVERRAIRWAGLGERHGRAALAAERARVREVDEEGRRSSPAVGTGSETRCPPRRGPAVVRSRGCTLVGVYGAIRRYADSPNRLFLRPIPDTRGQDRATSVSRRIPRTWRFPSYVEIIPQKLPRHRRDRRWCGRHRCRAPRRECRRDSPRRTSPRRPAMRTATYATSSTSS